MSTPVTGASDTSAPPTVDDATRQRIVEAHFELICEGDLRPTGDRIAQRAGVPPEAVTAAFPDRELLFAATSELLMRWQDDVFRPIPAHLPLARRIDDFCRQRMRMLEIVAPSAQAAQLREPFSPQLRRSRARHIARVRAEIEQVFGTELAVAGGGRGNLLHALTIATTWASWSVLRDELKLDAEQACAVLTDTVTGLLVAAVATSLR